VQQTSTHSYYTGVTPILGNWAVRDLNAAVDRLTVLPDGRIGIGTSQPGYALEIAGQGDAQFALRSLSTSGRVYSFQSSNGDENLGDGSFQIIDRTAGAARLYITKVGAVGIGASTSFPPTAALDVRGDVTLGASGELFAPGGEEKLRFIRGTVGGNGSSGAGVGFTAARGSVGVYTVTFANGFSSKPTVTVAIDNNFGFISFQAISDNKSMLVVTRDTNNTLADLGFTFIVAGPR
jgi:hypothetical protein